MERYKLKTGVRTEAALPVGYHVGFSGPIVVAVSVMVHLAYMLLFLTS